MPACAKENNQVQLPQVSVGNKKISVEIANNPNARQVGLMYRKEMSDEQGMLFVFPNIEKLCFWMKNTLIPLTAIFIAENGDVVNYADMRPLDESSHCSVAPAKYVLEVNQGWLKKYKLENEKKVNIPANIFAW